MRIKRVEDVEAMVEDLGVCFGLTDARKRMPSVYIGVCGRRDAQMPRNVQKDAEASAAWVLKDETMLRGKVYYAKLVKGNSMFIAPRLIAAFNAICGCTKAGEAGILSKDAQIVLKVLRKEWEMATSDLRKECGIKERSDLTKALEELQKRMKVVPQEAVYTPKFTYIWTLAEARFPKELKVKMSREQAIYILAKNYLQMCGMTMLGELAGKFSLSRKEAGAANHRLVDEGFATRVDRGIYRLTGL